MSFRAILHVQEVFQMRLSIREKDGPRDHAEFFSTLKELVLHFFCETGGRNSHHSSSFFRCHWKFRSLHYGCEFINMKISFHWQNECCAKRFISKALHQTDLSFSAVSSYSNVIKKVTDLKRKIFFKRWKPCWR